MKKSYLPIFVAGISLQAAIPALAQNQGSGDAVIFNPAFNPSVSGSTGSYAQVGGEFHLLAAGVPSGDTVYVTALGWYSIAGTAPAVNYTISLYGPGTAALQNLSSDLIGTGTVASGTALSSDGFAWVTLTTPIALTAGDYYNLIENAATGNVTYYQPYQGGGTTGPAVVTPPAGSPFAAVEGMYNNSTGYAYSSSEYLGPDMQYEIEGPTPVPEPATIALLAGGFVTALGLRRRR
ncbi:MAG TPA: PEP-CTERM sorting domain-containing protein [Verrucomicrobiae bacterium]|nr:PEP-CTERM sorting domain-containing protein [Verrucomicrobiae bacterium]